MTTAAVYLVGWAIFFVWQPEMSDTPALVVWVGSGLLAGFLIGRSWALGLSLGFAAVALLGLVAINPCDESQAGYECDVNWWVLIPLYALLTAATLAPGVFIRQLARSRRHRHRPG